MKDSSATKVETELERLIAVVAQLRAPGGCAWDAQQTHESLVRYLIEECYELVAAIESGDREDLLEELGDVLLQVLFHADIAADTPAENFTIEDVARASAEKMIGRHPHVFGSPEHKTVAELEANWDQLKRQEKPERQGLFDGVPEAIPSLLLADKYLSKGAEALPVQASGNLLPEGSFPEDEEALGELLFQIVARAKNTGMDSERALRKRLRQYRSDAEHAAGQLNPRDRDSSTAQGSSQDNPAKADGIS